MNLPDASGHLGKRLAVGAHRFNVLAAMIGCLTLNQYRRLGGWQWFT
jgi:hypothetical protein